jgi:hypothetical protein
MSLLHGPSRLNGSPRLGRAFNTTLLLGTQRTADLDGLSERVLKPLCSGG